jgi:hypothetical protein
VPHRGRQRPVGGGGGHRFAQCRVDGVQGVGQVGCCGGPEVEHLAARAARDFDAVCAGHGQRSGDLGDVPVLSCDGKGVVMCADAVRPAPRRVADTTATKLATRPSKGESWIGTRDRRRHPRRTLRRRGPATYR